MRITITFTCQTLRKMNPTASKIELPEKKTNLAGHPAPEAYKTKNKVRIVTAASLFDGHDAAINVMRRIMQSKGAEIIHLGHNRSVHEIVECAIEEDAQGIAITSYQG